MKYFSLIALVALAACTSPTAQKSNTSKDYLHETLKGVDVNYEIYSTNKGSINKISIMAFGNSTDTLHTAYPIYGTFGERYSKDLDADGKEELILFTTSAGSGSYGKSTCIYHLQQQDLSNSISKNR